MGIQCNRLGAAFMAVYSSKIAALIAIFSSVVILSACENTRSLNGREKGALGGGALGAGLGAIVGNQVGSSGAGIAIGAATGAIAGGLIGNSQDSSDKGQTEQEERLRRQEEELRRQRRELDELRKGERSGSDYDRSDRYDRSRY